MKDTFDIADDKVQVTTLSSEKKVFLAKLENRKDKFSIMKRKKEKLNGTKVFIDNDLTTKEKEIAFKLRDRVRSERANGKTAKINGNRIILQTSTLTWDEVHRRFVEKPLNNQSQSQTILVDTGAEAMDAESSETKNY